MAQTRAGSLRRRAGVAMLLSAVGLAGLASAPAGADVTAVTGGASGYFASVALFGGAPSVFGPAPTVTLPAAGGSETDSAPSGAATVGPATFFESGPLDVNTEGTTGAGGSVTSSASVEFLQPQSDQADPFNADSLRSTCTASESGVSASTTLTNASLVTSTDDEGEPVTTVELPTNPAPNLEFMGTINNINDSFRAVFNEQITNPSGTITVRAVHLYLLGVSAVGDVIIGEAVCGVTSDGNTGTTTTTTAPDGPTTTTAPDGPTTTTAPDGPTTTTAPDGPTTTTAPDGPSTTLLPTTTTTPPDPGDECAPAPGSFSARILELAQVFGDLVPGLQESLDRVSQTVCQLEQRFGFGGGFGGGFGFGA